MNRRQLIPLMAALGLSLIAGCASPDPVQLQVKAEAASAKRVGFVIRMSSSTNLRLMQSGSQGVNALEQDMVRTRFYRQLKPQLQSMLQMHIEYVLKSRGYDVLRLETLTSAERSNVDAVIVLDEMNLFAYHESTLFDANRFRVGIEGFAQILVSTDGATGNRVMNVYPTKRNQAQIALKKEDLNDDKLLVQALDRSVLGWVDFTLGTYFPRKNKN